MLAVDIVIVAESILCLAAKILADHRRVFVIAQYDCSKADRACGKLLSSVKFPSTMNQELEQAINDVFVTPLSLTDINTLYRDKYRDNLEIKDHQPLFGYLLPEKQRAEKFDALIERFSKTSWDESVVQNYGAFVRGKLARLANDANYSELDLRVQAMRIGACGLVGVRLFGPGLSVALEGNTVSIPEYCGVPVFYANSGMR